MPDRQPTAVILGANASRARFSNKSVRAHLQAGYLVYPVHPRETEVENLPCYPNLDAVPRPIDRVSLYVPPAAGLKEVDAIARTEAAEVWLNPGTESPELIQALRERGLHVVTGCSIVDCGFSPSQFPE
jgi:predicted CoA-binding protein